MRKLLGFGIFATTAWIVLATGGPGALVPFKAAAQAAAEVSVAFVVDFGGSQGALAACVKVPSTDNGYQALSAFTAQEGKASPTYNSSGLLCSIGGVPSSGCGQAVGHSYIYWSYWHGDSGSWVYSNAGAFGNAHPCNAQGGECDVEGWRFENPGAGNPTDTPPQVPPTYASICASGPGTTTTSGSSSSTGSPGSATSSAGPAPTGGSAPGTGTNPASPGSPPASALSNGATATSGGTSTPSASTPSASTPSASTPSGGLATSPSDLPTSASVAAGGGSSAPTAPTAQAGGAGPSPSAGALASTGFGPGARWTAIAGGVVLLVGIALFFNDDRIRRVWRQLFRARIDRARLSARFWRGPSERRRTGTIDGFATFVRSQPPSRLTRWLLGR